MEEIKKNKAKIIAVKNKKRRIAERSEGKNGKLGDW